MDKLDVVHKRIRICNMGDAVFIGAIRGSRGKAPPLFSPAYDAWERKVEEVRIMHDAFLDRVLPSTK